MLPRNNADATYSEKTHCYIFKTKRCTELKTDQQIYAQKWLLQDKGENSKFFILVSSDVTWKPRIQLMTSVRSSFCSSVRNVALLLRSSVPPFLRSSFPPFLCSTVPLFHSSSVPLLLSSSVTQFLYSIVRSSLRLFPCCSFSFVPTVFVFLSIYLMTSVRSSYMRHKPKCCGLRRHSHKKFSRLRWRISLLIRVLYRQL